MSTSFTPIRVDTKEVGHIHVLFPTLEYSVPVGRPPVPGLTSPRAIRSRVLQASSALRASGAYCPFLESVECIE